ncbi:polysaccharide deacetylase family protein [Paenibacillus wynnii]|uniref:polysaccharide deacetylase family protein n=1 Tax=Paenibacillus wynnii TaxID=268407 RepID=UPI002792FCEE|nr:polysaccharide deacetylase family protein [Paenibacillus wynnii]MDQ0192438.1 peptidoglycan/xylan/chitin deacetylase (PgdA/CDA1 family) [Paenibacillus wynnii]
MPANEPNTLLMIELLSLEHRLTGYQIEVGLTRNDGYAKCVLTIDEYTYTQLNLLGPFNLGRVRLSFYTKWDPYRNVHFSTLIKMNKTFSETLYFACSEYYVSQLLQLKQPENPHSEDVMVYQPELPSTTPEQTKYRKDRQPFGRIALRCIMFSFLLLLLSLRWDESLFTDRVEALEEPVNVSLKGDSVNLLQPLIRTASIQIAPIDPPSDDISDPPNKPSRTPNNEFELDIDTFEYGLPKGYVALTFDDGPSSYTKQIVDILVEHNVSASFFFVGRNVLHRPDEVKYAHEHDMPIGNHSWDHSEMTGNTDQENETNLLKVNQALENIIQSPITMFRPPYGSIDHNLADKVMDQHMKVLLWNRDPEDWRAKSPEEILNYFHKADSSGGIFLLHERKFTVEALPEIIEYLQSKNLKFAIFK